MQDYLVISGQGKDCEREAYTPDLPGLGAAAETREEHATLIRGGIRIYIKVLRADCMPLLEPVTTAERICVAA